MKRQMSQVLVFLYLVLQMYICVTDLFSQQQQNISYVGVKNCNCHNSLSRGKQIDVWKQSKHSNAYKTLMTDSASVFAKNIGLKSSANNSNECIVCHTTGSKDYITKNFPVEEGVICESCHGAASLWRNIHKRWNKKADAIEAGLILINLTDYTKPTIEQGCRKCHNENSPTYKKFDFDEYWAKINHPTPQK